MVECPHCGNKKKEELFQHDKSLAGYRDYGRVFTCLRCKKGFTVDTKEANDDVITKWPDV